ncbi:MAG: radical SAM protein [candidate division WOR-3 bacterium]
MDDNELNQENKRYKPSKYNFFFDAEDGTHLAFNALSGGFAELTDERISIVKDILSHKEINYTNKIQKEVWDNLIRGGFILESDVNEIDLIKITNYIQRFNRSFDLSLTILPTFKCNFRCAYCYEGVKKNKSMGIDVQTKLTKMIESGVGMLKNLHITWMGGEPLLGYKVIVTLSQKIQQICEKGGIKYSAGIITNGYLLNNFIFRRLADDMAVNFFQITIDGPREIHDGRRPLSTGRGSFDRIINNLTKIAESKKDKKRIKIVVRVNIDKSNSDCADRLLDILAGMKLKDLLTIVPAPIEAVSSTCADITDVCLSPTEFYRSIQLKFFKRLLESGFNFDIYPKLVGSNCIADRINAYVIAPDGLLYKCWNDVGIIAESIGFITDDGKIVHNHNIVKWLAYDPFNIKECQECKIFPLCGGGCAYKRLNSKGNLCVSWKYNIEEFLKLYYLSKKCRKEVIKYEVPT